MNWRVKAFTQALLSHLPLGHELNYLLRRHVTMTVPANDTVFGHDCAFAAEHAEAFRKYGTRPLEDALFYEFGAGWDLTIPLAFYSLGVDRQLVVDLRRLIKVALVRHTSSHLSKCREQLGLMRAPGALPGVISRPQLVTRLLTSCGIDYRAPFDARDTGIDSESVDYITATKVLAQIPVEDLRGILRECHRILRPRGLIRVLNDYRDTYSYADQSISVYNFLQFSDEEWRRYNPALNYQNRLRHVDCVRLFIEAGFEIVESGPGYDRDAPREVLEKTPLAARFRCYSLDELAPVRGVILARKPDGVAPGRCALPLKPCKDDFLDVRSDHEG